MNNYQALKEFDNLINYYFNTRKITRAGFDKRCPQASAGDSMEKTIINLYQQLRSSIQSAQGSKEQVIIDKTLNSTKDTDQHPVYKIIGLMQRQLKPVEQLIHSCLVHGSYATQDFVPNWSDLDVLIIFNHELFANQENILNMRQAIQKTSPLFYSIDPLAHHFYHIFTELDLASYYQGSMPLATYQNGLLLLGQNKVEFNLIDIKIKETQLERYKKHFAQRKNNLPTTLFDLKLDLSYLFLLPSFLLQTKDIYLYKRDSFSRVEKEFSQINFNIIHQASAIRQNWPATGRGYTVHRLSIYAQRLLAKRKKINNLNHQELKELITHISYLFDSAHKHAT